MGGQQPNIISLCLVLREQQEGIFVLFFVWREKGRMGAQQHNIISLYLVLREQQEGIFVLFCFVLFCFGWERERENGGGGGGEWGEKSEGGRRWALLCLGKINPFFFYLLLFPGNL